MKSLNLGWSFLIQAWQMAFKDKDLLKPSIYSLVVGIGISIIGILPIIGAYLLFGETGLGQAITFVLGALMVFVNFLVTYLFSGMTAYLIFGYLSEGDGRMDKAWDIVRRDFFDIITLAAASTIVNIIKDIFKKQSQQRGNIIASVVAGASSLFEVLWSEAAYLILPAMVIDDLNLKSGLRRVVEIIKSNLLLIGISTIGVRWVTGIIGVFLGIIGAGIGLGIGYGIISVLGTEVLGLTLGIGIGALIFFIFVLVASIINKYTDTAYHTCLYIWAREVEKAQASGQSVQVAAPAPLAAVLG